MIDTLRTVLGMSLIGGGLFFFIAATVGLFRFPDASCRIHAVSKADSSGLGLVIAGVAVQSTSLAFAAKLVAIWLLALVASAFIGQLIGRAAKPNEGGS